MESMFPRIESQISVPTEENILDWLTKDRNGQVVRKRTEGLRRLARAEARPFEIRYNIENANNYSNLRDYSEEINNLSVTNADSELGLTSLLRDKEKEITENLKSAIRSSGSISELEQVDYEGASVNVFNELSRLVGSRRAFIERSESVREIIYSREAFEERGSRWRTVGSLSDFLNLSEEETTQRLENIGVSVENGRIIR